VHFIMQTRQFDNLRTRVRADMHPSSTQPKVRLKPVVLQDHDHLACPPTVRTGCRFVLGVAGDGSGYGPGEGRVHHETPPGSTTT
jgi:hypothetical protein